MLTLLDSVFLSEHVGEEILPFSPEVQLVNIVLTLIKNKIELREYVRWRPRTILTKLNHKNYLEL